MRTWGRAAIALCAASVCGCGRGDEVPERMLPPPAAVQRAVTESPALGALLRALAQPPTARIGNLSGDGSYMFGQLSDALATVDGRVLVADAQSGDVRAFDLEGGFLQLVGAAGRGPGEFLSPVDLSVGDGFLLVADESNRVQRFRLDGALAHAGGVAIDIPAYAACPLSDTKLAYHAVMFGSNSTVHITDWDGHAAVHVAPPDTSAHPFVSWRRSTGRLTCNAVVLRLILARELDPTIRVFTFDGEATIAIEIPHFLPLFMEVNDRGGVAQEYLKAHSTVWSTVVLPDGRVLVQVAWHTRSSVSDKRYFAWLETFVTDVMTGQIVPLSTDLPWIMDVNRDVVLVGKIEPYPSVEIHRYSEDRLGGTP